MMFSTAGWRKRNAPHPTVRCKMSSLPCRETSSRWVEGGEGGMATHSTWAAGLQGCRAGRRRGAVDGVWRWLAGGGGSRWRLAVAGWRQRLTVASGGGSRRLVASAAVARQGFRSSGLRII